MATTWIAAGKNLVKVQKAMGHANIQTTMRYVHLVDGDLDDLVDDWTEDVREAVNG